MVATPVVPKVKAYNALIAFMRTRHGLSYVDELRPISNGMIKRARKYVAAIESILAHGDTHRRLAIGMQMNTFCICALVSLFALDGRHC
jgi:hypothetical protein